MKKLSVILLLAICLLAEAKSPLTAADSLSLFHESTAVNSGKVHQEMIYLHLDNTSYYRNDRIFFAGYLVRSGDLKPSGLSQTVYVELLNPNGKIIDRCTLKSVNGRFHGSMSVKEQPFYSGYYEIRAFTRYMLSFGSQNAFSRVIPIFDLPKTEGNWSERKMRDYGSPTLEYNRPKPQKTKNVNIKLYPEGGRIIAGLRTTVAVELTDNNGRPLQAVGRLICSTDGSTVTDFECGHMGRSTFSFTPSATRKYKAEFKVGNKRYSSNLPEIVPAGISPEVDNLSSPDSVMVKVRCTPDFHSKTVGASVTCRNHVYGRYILDLNTNDSTSFSIPRSKLPTGICRLTIFDGTGSPLTDRLFFNNRNDFVNIECEFNRPRYAPLEPVELTIALKGSEAIPGHVSVSITDAADRVDYRANIMSELLLSSELKGYIHNPAWYFADPADAGRQRALDRLLMIQGWRRYSWKRLAGTEDFRIDSMPERGIEVHGKVLKRWRDKPIAGAVISVMLSKAGTDSTDREMRVLDTFTTDRNGQFSFRCDVNGKYMMTLSAAQKGKLKPCRIILSSTDSPDVRAYEPGEMTFEVATDLPTVDPAFGSGAENEDSVIIPHKGKLLKEIEVTANAAPWDIGQIVENATVCYDVEMARESLINEGNRKPLRNLKDILPLIDPNFHYHTSSAVIYRGRSVIFVLDPNLGNNKTSAYEEYENVDMAQLPIETIKNVFVTTDDEVIYELVCRMFPEKQLKKRLETCRRIGCAVYIELHEQQRAQLRYGMRRSMLEGYSEPVEFYSPDYSTLPPVETDCRRTIYWNPDVEIDSTGSAKLRFFNNSTASRFVITTATVTPEGKIGGN